MNSDNKKKKKMMKSRYELMQFYKSNAGVLSDCKIKTSSVTKLKVSTLTNYH